MLEAHPNEGLDSNYCRNPIGFPTIWCVTETNAEGMLTDYEFCSPHPQDDIVGKCPKEGVLMPELQSEQAEIRVFCVDDNKELTPKDVKFNYVKDKDKNEDNWWKSQLRAFNR